MIQAINNRLTESLLYAQGFRKVDHIQGCITFEREAQVSRGRWARLRVRRSLIPDSEGWTLQLWTGRAKCEIRGATPDDLQCMFRVAGIEDRERAAA